MKYDTAQPYTAAYVILRQGSKVAFVLRQKTAWMNGYYGLPSGKVEKGESFTAAACREAFEEVGVSIEPSDLRHALTVHRNDVDSYWVDVYFEVSTWTGEVSNVEADVHSEVAWLDIHDLPANVIPGVRSALECIDSGKYFMESGWEVQA